MHHLQSLFHSFYKLTEPRNKSIVKYKGPPEYDRCPGPSNPGESEDDKTDVYLAPEDDGALYLPFIVPDRIVEVLIVFSSQ